MLGKLIKYDLKYIYKQLIIFYIIVLCLAILARLTADIEGNFLIKFIHEFAQGATFGFSFGMIINASMRMWAKYKYSLYGDESYLTHTLPLSHRTIWTAKFLTSIIIIAISLALFVLCMVIIFLTPTAIEAFRVHGAELWHYIFTFIFAIFCQFCFIMQCGLLGITIGHRFNSHRMPISVIAGIAIYILGGIIILGSCMIWQQFDPAISAIITNNDISNPSVLAKLFTGIGVIYLALIGASYFINGSLLRRGVNVD